MQEAMGDTAFGDSVAQAGVATASYNPYNTQQLEWDEYVEEQESLS